ncbi:hypothetical protein SSX86_009939 [Deinandra increscens subsp. villosa]|uniref:BSD domain-containing protein n=1 Tax=Deinandra increscens subsp. villosa TaxID=3103831 RepID=A0AAP0H3X8_9ASTR
MSYSFFSLPNPINSDDETYPPPPPSPTAVKSDFSAITQTIGRQLHNVASFLAPPPPPPPPPQQPSSTPPPPLLSDDDVSVSPSSSSYEGLKNDLAEIGDRFKTGLSLLSPTKAVTGISKFASNLLQFDKRNDDLDLDFDVVGVTDEIVDFVREISTRPECWIDFPLSLQNKDFNMSQFQKDHAMAIQELVPNLTTLRHAIHNYMSDQQFWMIYFILLVPRLNEDDYRHLSTPEIVQVREIVLQKLRHKNTPEEKGSMVNLTEQSEHPFHEIESVSDSDNTTNRIRNKNNEGDVSFSDLDDESLSGIKQTQSSRFSSASENSDWVRLSGTSKANRSICRGRRSESEESSSDWHAVEDVDL